MMDSCSASEGAVNVLTLWNWCQGEKKDWNATVKLVCNNLLNATTEI